MPKLTPETRLKKAIKQYLKAIGVFHFHVLQGLGAYKGVSDILGFYKKRFLAIEVKSPNGRLSEHQKRFLAQVENNGGITIVAYSVEDVINGLKFKTRERKNQ